MKRKKVYHPISVNKKLPVEEKQYEYFICSKEVVVIDKQFGLQKAWTKRYTRDLLDNKKGHFEWEASRGCIISEVTHWLEETELYVCDEKLFNKIISSVKLLESGIWAADPTQQDVVIVSLKKLVDKLLTVIKK